MSDTIYFTQGQPEALGGHIKLVEGAGKTWVCNYNWSNPSAPSAAKAYRSTSGSGNGTDVSATVFPTNSPSASGANVTLSAAAGFVGNATYKIVVSATVDSQPDVHYFFVDVVKDESMS